VRSWIHEGATILVPPTTVPLIEGIASSPIQLEPDALAAEPRAPEIRVVDGDLHLEDAANLLVVYSIASEHTDEYLIFYFPRQRVLLGGDLLFYRPGEALTGRSLRFARTVTELGLEFDSVRCTWPLRRLRHEERGHARRACARRWTHRGEGRAGTARSGRGVARASRYPGAPPPRVPRSRRMP
jgi:hypothetical protein